MAYRTDLGSIKDWEYVDVTFRLVHGCGFMPIIKMEEQQVYRGEFHSSIEDAMHFMQDYLIRLGICNPTLQGWETRFPKPKAPPPSDNIMLNLYKKERQYERGRGEQ